MTPILMARELAWRAGDSTIVQDVTFNVSAGELVALMGRNGAGKSTVMNVLAGLRVPHAGTVLLDGRPLGTWSPLERARRVGHLPQLVSTQSPLSVEQIVTMGRYPHTDQWIESEGDRIVVERAMAQCGCLPLRDRRLSTLSGGERQRVLFAACLAQEPAVLLLDEPATFLDVDQQLQSFEMLRMRAQEGAACVAVTHDINMALTFCTRVIVLAHQTIARDMPIEVAMDSNDWLELFSPRLRRLTIPGGRCWIAYQ